MSRKITKIVILLLSLLLCFAMTSCITVMSSLGQLYSDALSTDDISDRQYVYGDSNPLGVTFADGNMYAEWDYSAAATYTLSVKADNETKSYTEEDEGFEVGKVNLTTLGYGHWQDLAIELVSTTQTLSGKHVRTRSYNYAGINRADYDKYTNVVTAGFKEIDYYIANRAEWFDFWSYLIIFRENSKYNNGCYELESKIYMGYDYAALYDSNDVQKAFANEVYSAIDAYEDSAAYNYSFEIDNSGKKATVRLKFLYAADPKYTSPSGTKYVNAVDKSETIHYRNNIEGNDRKFDIDSVKDAISVSSSDQLYFALKKGYRPSPAKGSNAELLYNKMRSILANILTDSDTEVTKAHYIYDYLVNTVIYDYEFTDSIYTDKEKTVSELFSYRCLYMEGVFGLGDNGVFDDGSRVAICDGLSKAYLSLATIEGLECLKISGTVNNEGHAWNKVKVNGNWYMVDVTWGNSLEKSTNNEYFNHKYILVPDDTSHVETPYISYPVANLRYNFGITIDNDPTDDDKAVNPWFTGWRHNYPHYSA